MMLDTATSGSSPSPVGSEIFALLALIAISVVVILILRFYMPLRTTPAYLLVPVFFALWLPACMVLLVPIDLASSAKTDDVDARGIWLERRPLLVSWRITYWLTFALTWFVLPILAEYSDSGYRDPKDKVMDSLRANAQYYAAVFGSGLLGLIYVLVYYGHFSESLKSTVMALAYCWGLVLAIYLMGHGLVAIPRRLFRDANIGDRLRRLQARAPALFEKMEDAEMDLEELEARVAELSQRKTGSARDFQDWIEELVEMVSLPETVRPRPGSLFRSGTGDAEGRGHLPTVLTAKYMADLTRRLMRAKHARARYASEWNALLQEAVETQAIMDSAASKKLAFGAPSPESSGFWDGLNVFTPYTRYLFHYRVLPYVRISAGAFLSVASACIVWSELVKGLFPSASVIRYSVVHYWHGDKGQVGFAGQVVAVFWMLYMCAAALVSITEVKVWRGRALVRRNTAHESAFWYAGQVARLSIPLSYNFMTFLGGATYRDTVFYDFLGQLINLTPLGEWFDYLFPAFILVPVCATLFGLYGRVKRLFGFGVDMMDDEADGEESGRSTAGYGANGWRTGRDLIERELNGTSAAIRGRRAEAVARLGNENHGRQSPSLSLGQGRGGAAPTVSVPGAPRREPRGGPSTPFATSPNTRPQANTSARRVGASSSSAAAAWEPEDDDNFLGSLGHRFKNTIDTLETPRWLQELGQGIKKPKWMGSNNNDDGGSSAAAGGGRPRGHERTSSDVRRWFGGGSDGRIRL